MKPAAVVLGAVAWAAILAQASFTSAEAVVATIGIGVIARVFQRAQEWES